MLALCVHMFLLYNNVLVVNTLQKLKYFSISVPGIIINDSYKVWDSEIYNNFVNWCKYLYH